MDNSLNELLVCPVSKAPMTLDTEKQEWVCEQSGLAYPIRNGIPVLLEEEARKLGTS